jgi:hypothetical protein
VQLPATFGALAAFMSTIAAARPSEIAVIRTPGAAFLLTWALRQPVDRITPPAAASITESCHAGSAGWPS